MPQRIQLRRTKGWRKPEGAVVVARPSKWGNPFKAGEVVTHPAYRPFAGSGPIDAAKAVDLYDLRTHVRYMLDADQTLMPMRDLIRKELAGKTLACWCPIGSPCHADVLLEIANPSAHLGPDPQ
jgi:hypothetical protein